ncbi:N-acetylmuramoyl-L-alanine amidase [Dysgonomonas sp. Marseille-P4677]|uniref:N-acetylmuramoyl-L-alanine amidase n=1 Tax=Dysgonomonas sp. Marseille-P4677 TaxID=2364790 RepID=UPI0019145772|nr:N-acetylmuramoyl-L-alanine amidase [Dysgonomonas sp. Marseille-P4677]MBK5720153.1 N-acetylmuramoyl-L-alanine amidase [Dysgonomonas sp. Marseille-P4677]
MKRLLIILDPAHGEEVEGKRSPDGRHREYRWSRERLKQIELLLTACGYTVVWTNTTDAEIGLTKRKNVATQLGKQHPDLVPLLVSLHNDASGVTPEWRQARGVSVWTSKGRTTSDIFADYFIQRIQEWMPEVQRRIYSPTYLDRDFENDFTVLMGDYSALLIECGFQDNREDLSLLEDPKFCKRIEDRIVDSIEDCENYITQKLSK